MRRLLSSIVLFPAAALAQSGQERLTAPALPGFIVGYTAANARQSIREEVPRGETVQAWTRMVTTQRFTGLARLKEPVRYVRDSMAGLASACPGARTTLVDGITVSGRPAARVMADCPRSTGGVAESFILLAIAGPAGDMHVKQVAWRGKPGPQELSWAANFMSGVRLCAAADRTPACR